MTYNNPGSYLVTLSVGNAFGEDSFETLVTVYGSPLVDFTTFNLGGKTVEFSNLSQYGTTYQWDFGDGSGSTTPSPTHTYASNGTYTVTLTVTNACGSNESYRMVTVGTLSPKVLYVNHAATGANNGASWLDAFVALQDAIDSATAGDEVWVARGVYKPSKTHDGTTNRDRTFFINKDIAIYGGFKGDESALLERDIDNNATILSGDIDDNDVNIDGNFIAERTTDLVGDNVYHVVWIEAVSNIMRLDGFSITAGMATDFHFGGGIHNNGYGSINGSNPDIANCIFSGNLADAGGALANFHDGNAVLTDCIFFGNLAIDGGAMLNFNNSNLVLNNCIFYNNASSARGGAIQNVDMSSLVLVNCTLFGNTALENGGALYNWSGNAVLTNCILWGNTSIGDGPVFYVNNAATVTLRYSLVDATDCAALNAGNGTGICADSMIYNQYPLFVDTANGDLRLSPTSPAIDKGDNNAVVAVTDLKGNPRIFNGRVDLGAYELQASCFSGTILYVKSDATGANDGTSWENAFPNFQAALDMANSGICPDIQEIWIAAGTYLPTADTTGNPNPANPREKTFYLRDHSIKIYGGFAGTETALSDRDTSGNTTVLSGDIGMPGNMNDNAYHVMHLRNLSAQTVLDGFTISGGRANGTVFPASAGGGIFNENADIGIANCTFIANSANLGGGVCNSNSSPLLTGCRFLENSAIGANAAGGAMFSHQDSDPKVGNCYFADNFSAQSGGAMFNSGTDCNPVLTNTIFINNSANWYGGAVNNNNGSSPTVTNCLFFYNSADAGGAMYNSGAGSPLLINCTFSWNSASGNGGAMYSANNNNPVLKNCILWENTAPAGPVFFSETSANKVTISYSLADAASCDALSAGNGTVDCSGGGMLYNKDPKFMDAVNFDLRLHPSSPAIDKGDNNAVPSGVVVDLDGNNRIFNNTVDMGPYESQVPPQSDTLLLIVGNVSGPVGTLLHIPVTTENFNDIHGIQGTARIALPDQFRFEGVEAAALTLFAPTLTPGQDAMSLTWSSPIGLTLPDGDTLFYLIVRIEGQPDECKTLSINSSIWLMKAYKDAFTAIPVKAESGSACILSNVQVSGKVVYEDGSAAQDIPLTLMSSQSGASNITAYTNAAGTYFFNNLPGGYTYTVRPAPKTNTIDPDCVDIGDAIFLNGLLAGSILYSEFIKIASDINGDGIVNTADLMVLQTLGAFQPAWRFVAVNDVFLPQPDPFVPDYKEAYNLPDLVIDIADRDFVAIEIGNINGECTPGNKMMTSGNLAFLFEKECRQGENLVFYHLKARNWQDIAAFQVALSFDTRQLEFLRLLSGCLDEWEQGILSQPQVREGVLPLLWFASDPTTACHSVEDGTILLSLVFRVRQDNCPVSCELSVAEEDILPRTYDLAMESMSIRVPAAPAGSDAPRLLQNRPNPFDSETVIPVFLPVNTPNAEIRITDMLGREIARIPINGFGEILIPFRPEKLATGVYFCSLFVDGKVTDSRRMLVQ
ncbi:MAG: PKD domain-containing protein [Saprospiraceae bacterium]|nr:PKD domain-containing protein [Saprospiraceae bacterium]